MIHADRALARRIEAAEAGNARDCTGANAEVLEIAGGVAIFAGAESPLTQVVGIGLNGAVRAAEIDAIESFFHCRGATVHIDVCPLADPGLMEELTRRGYSPGEFNNLLMREIAGLEVAPAPGVRLISPDESELWAQTVGEGFFDKAPLAEEELDVGRAITSVPGALCYLAVAEHGEPAGAAAMTVHSGLATFFADTTIAPYRRRGLHSALIRARLLEAAARGCDLATATAQPGSTSQRNFETAGFHIAYTKIELHSKFL